MVFNSLLILSRQDLNNDTVGALLSAIELMILKFELMLLKCELMLLEY